MTRKTIFYRGSMFFVVFSKIWIRIKIRILVTLSFFPIDYFSRSDSYLFPSIYILSEYSFNRDVFRAFSSCQMVIIGDNQSTFRDSWNIDFKFTKISELLLYLTIAYISKEYWRYVFYQIVFHISTNCIFPWIISIRSVNWIRKDERFTLPYISCNELCK